MNVRQLLLTVLASCFIQSCTSARIVVTYIVPCKSQILAVLPLVEELAKKGHQVTVFTVFEGVSENVVNGREVFISPTFDESELDWFAMSEMQETQILSMFPFFNEVGKAGEELVANPIFQEIIKNRDVDLFIVDALFHEFLFPIFDSIGVPFVSHSSCAIFSSVLAAMGAPIDYASIPTNLVDYDIQMTFSERLTNFLLNEVFNFVRVQYFYKNMDNIVQSYFPGVRSSTEVEGEASLCIINSHPITNWPRSLPPTILPIGALHTRPAKPLPEKFKEFADGAKEGLIIFTLGSLIPVSSMPKKTVETFIRVFSKLPQRVVWKWEGEIPANIPSNIMMSDWLPQQDLLGHPNAKVFVTHGGMLGTQEAAYHGVPLLGIPFGNDQRGNVANARRAGWGIRLDWNKINDQNLIDAFSYLINNSNVRENVSRVSRLMRDEIMPGLDIAVYWIEYVLRHGGTKHLQITSKNLPFYKQNLIDITLFLFSVLLVIVFFIYGFIRLVLRTFLGKKVKTKIN